MFPKFSTRYDSRNTFVYGRVVHEDVLYSVQDHNADTSFAETYPDEVAANASNYFQDMFAEDEDDF